MTSAGNPVCIPCGDRSCPLGDTTPCGHPSCVAPVARSGACALAARGVTLAYDRRIVSAQLDVDLPEGAVTAIVGPNACGKSTLLRALSRLLAPRAGEVLLDGEFMRDLGRRDFAQRVGLLPQSPAPPSDVTVEELVSAGRSPYQRWYRQWSAEDERAHRMEAIL